MYFPLSKIKADVLSSDNKLLFTSKVAGFLDIILFKKLFEYTQYLVLSSLAPLRNSELAVVLAVVLAVFPCGVRTQGYGCKIVVVVLGMHTILQ